MEQAVANYGSAGVRADWTEEQFLRQSAWLDKQSLPAFVKALRVSAYKTFKNSGFAGSKNEAWKYTNVSQLRAQNFECAVFSEGEVLSSKDASSHLVADVKAHTLVFLNGIFQPEASSREVLPDGLQVLPIARALCDGEAFKPLRALIQRHLCRCADGQKNSIVALNTAFLFDGAVIYVPEGAAFKNPVHILHLSGGEGERASFPRLLVIAEKESRVTVLESFASLDDRKHFSAPVSEIIAGENASVSYIKLQNENHKSIHLGHLAVRIEQHGVFNAHFASLGGALVRNEISPVLCGQGVECSLSGVTLLGGVQHADNHIVVQHAEPHGRSLQKFRGVYADRSQGVFSGTIIVDKDAQKTNAYQSNDSILLSQQAAVNTRPQLKIWADDVRCTHGATVGQLDESALFYLRSRGIPAAQARNILLEAFVSDAVSGIPAPPIRAHVDAAITGKLNRMIA